MLLHKSGGLGGQGTCRAPKRSSNQMRCPSRSSFHESAQLGGREGGANMNIFCLSFNISRHPNNDPRISPIFSLVIASVRSDKQMELDLGPARGRMRLADCCCQIPDSTR